MSVHQADQKEYWQRVARVRYPMKVVREPGVIRTQYRDVLKQVVAEAVYSINEKTMTYYVED